MGGEFFFLCFRAALVSRFTVAIWGIEELPAGEASQVLAAAMRVHANDPDVLCTRAARQPTPFAHC